MTDFSLQSQEPSVTQAAGADPSTIVKILHQCGRYCQALLCQQISGCEPISTEMGDTARSTLITELLIV